MKEMFRKVFNNKQQGKVFCIGMNKTGTTSLGHTLNEHGFKVGKVSGFRKYLVDCAYRNYDGLIKHCESTSANAFQDSPFSWMHTFIPLDQRFPGSKFILSVRDSGEEWYKSLVRFHKKTWIDGDETLTPEVLKEKNDYYGNKILDLMCLKYGVSKENPYDKDTLIQYYLSHQNMVLDYFRNRKEDLLVINLNEENAYSRFCDFLGVSPILSDFPKLNVTKPL